MLTEQIHKNLILSCPALFIVTCLGQDAYEILPTRTCYAGKSLELGLVAFWEWWAKWLQLALKTSNLAAAASPPPPLTCRQHRYCFCAASLLQIFCQCCVIADIVALQAGWNHLVGKIQPVGCKLPGPGLEYKTAVTTAVPRIQHLMKWIQAHKSFCVSDLVKVHLYCGFSLISD